MEFEICWEDQVVAEGDNRIAELEAEILSSKAQLAKLGNDDEDLF